MIHTVEEDSWEPLGLQGDQPVNPKGNQSWIFIGRTDAEAETPIPWPPGEKNWLIGKDPDSGKDWRWEEKGTIEDEMVGWHHQLDGHEFEQALGVVDVQGSLVCYSPWGPKESDTTEWLNWTEYVNNYLSAIQETRAQSLSQEDPLEKATHSSILSILAWKIPWTEEPGGLESMGSQKSETT